jgi:hypothetical protein
MVYCKNNLFSQSWRDVKYGMISLMEIINQSGEREAYEPAKLCYSLEQAGISADAAQQVCLAIEEKIEPGVSTTKIFRAALRQLIKHEKDIEIIARYSLRRAVDALGPAGFLFEQYVEAVLQAHGYETQRNITMMGECVEHEVDVYAEKDGVGYIIEAKYHNERGVKTHIDKVMYADARLQDIRRRKAKDGDTRTYLMWIVTNTAFTHKAIDYASCRDLKLIGWKNSHDGSLQKMAMKKKIYPITVLPSLTQYARDQFAQHAMILAQDLLLHTEESLVKDFALSPKLAKKLLQEAASLIN